MVVEIDNGGVPDAADAAAFGSNGEDGFAPEIVTSDADKYAMRGAVTVIVSLAMGVAAAAQ
jgi:hypothetical protein